MQLLVLSKFPYCHLSIASSYRSTSFFNRVHIIYLLFLVHNVLFTYHRVFSGIVPSFLAPWIHKVPGHLDSFCTFVCKSFVLK